MERLLVLSQPVPLLLDLSEICFGRLKLRRGGGAMNRRGLPSEKETRNKKGRPERGSEQPKQNAFPQTMINA